jgi:hypothetical protein
MTKLFIVGTGRCGTKTLANTLSQLPGVTVHHEFEYNSMTVLARQFAQEEISRDEAAYHLVEILGRDKTEDQVVGYAHHALSWLLPLLKQTYENGIFLWSVRNALTFIPSALSCRWYAGGNGFVQQNFVRGRLYHEEDWDKADPFQKLCWYWSHLNHFIEMELLDVYAPIHRPWHMVRMEDLEQPPTTTWWFHLCHFLGIGHHPQDVARIKIEKHNASTSQPAYPFAAWTELHKLYFELMCSEMMDRLYPTWREDLSHGA